MRPQEVLQVFKHQTKIVNALTRLIQVGLGYIQIGQRLSTLSGGERQRLKLAAELERSGGIYVFDEPTSGLHMADVERLLELFTLLADQGKTVIIVEHNLEMIANADHVIEMGPGAGKHGGKIIYQGPPLGMLTSATSVTGPFLEEQMSGKHELLREGANKSSRYSGLHSNWRSRHLTEGMPGPVKVG
ncbi:ATP-binding cassette domain-containing protein [Shewanella algae]|uniref:ATP-binding cassette domain-containing protein n=2 Tax=Shewanella algae TaxID=38313 RepID=UPI0034D4C865